MDEKPLDLEKHKGDQTTSVWTRRIMFVLLIALCVAFAAPSDCSGLGSRTGETLGSYTIAGETRTVRDVEFGKTYESLQAMYALIGRERPISSDDVWQHMILADAARAEGVHVTDAQVASFLADVGFAKPDGSFDDAAYRRAVKQLGERAFADRAQVEARLKGAIALMTYMRAWTHPFQIVPSKELYDAWKQRNLLLTVDYVVKPFADFAAQVEAAPITDDDLKSVADLPEAIRERSVPGRRGFEVAYLRVRDVTPEGRAAMKEYLKTAGVFPEDLALESAGYRFYFGNRRAGDAFSRETWIASRMPEYTAAKAAWDAEKAEWDKKPDPKDPMRAAPEDPSSVKFPEKDVEIYQKYWLVPVTDELLATETLRIMAARAEREAKSFADLLPDFARYGVKVESSTELMTDAEIPAKFPAGLGATSEFAQIVRARFPEPAPGTPFAPKVSPDPVPACNQAALFTERGAFIVRWTEHKPAGLREPTEVRAALEKIERARRVSKAARDFLADLRKKAEEDAAAKGDGLAAALRRQAAAAGAEVHTLRRFSNSSFRPRPPETTDTPERKALAARVTHRNRVHDDYLVLFRGEEGKFRDPILHDEATGAAYLELLVSKTEPTPLEMDDSELSIERSGRRMQDQTLISNALSMATLEKRYDVVFSPEYRKRIDEERANRAEREAEQNQR